MDKCLQTGWPLDHLLDGCPDCSARLRAYVIEQDLLLYKDAQDRYEDETLFNHLVDSVCRRAILHFGPTIQVHKSIEELGELVAALGKDLVQTSEPRKISVIDEIADAFIMLRQLRVIYGSSAVDTRVLIKIDRLKERVGGDH